MSENFGLDAKPINPFDMAMELEGLSGPAADLARSIYMQESGGGRNTKTSNAGAVGGMQIIPSTFASVADNGWDINDPIHNARAGIRYVKQLHDSTEGDPRLTAIGYYGGPGAIKSARNGVAVSDPRNPNAPNTFQYAQQVLNRIGTPIANALIPAANAQGVSLQNQQPQEEFGLDAKPISEEFGLDAKPIQQVSSNPFVAFANGFGNGIGDVVYGAGHWIGKGAKAVGLDQFGDKMINDAKTLREGTKAKIKPYEEVSPISTGAGTLAGNIAATWPVGGAIGEGVSATVPALSKIAPSAVPYVEKLANAISSGGMKLGGAPASGFWGGAANMGLRSLGGAVNGAATAGLVNPDDMSTGAIVGAALPPAASGLYWAGKTAAQGVKSLAEPFYQGGRDLIVGRALRNVAGNNADDVVRSLETNASKVPGVQYTAGMAANNPGIAAMQRTASQVDPLMMNEFDRRVVGNNDALIAALKGAAPDKQAAIAARDAATESLYDLSRKGTVNLTDDLTSLMKRPSMKTAIARAEQLALDKGEDLKFVKSIPEQLGSIVSENGKPISTVAAQPGSMSGKAAHYIKLALDDLTEMTASNSLTKNQRNAMLGNKEAFLAAVEKQLPEYGMARTTFANLSKPVNQADVISTIADKGINFRGNLTPSAYSNALTDKVAQAATGFKGATLEGVMRPDQLKLLKEIEGDLLRQDYAQTAGRGVGSDTVQKLAFSNMLNQTGIPQVVRGFAPTAIVGNLLQRGGDAVYGSANKRLTEQLAQALLNPAESAALMRSSMTTPQMQAVIESLRLPQQIGFKAAPLMFAQ